MSTRNTFISGLLALLAVSPAASQDRCAAPQRPPVADDSLLAEFGPGENKIWDLNFLEGSNFIVRLVETAPAAEVVEVGRIEEDGVARVALGDVLRTTSILPGLARRDPGLSVTWVTAHAAGITFAPWGINACFLLLSPICNPSLRKRARMS